jgi:hypothetical protein
LPYVQAGARVAFYVVLGVFALLELRIRVRSGLNRQGTRLDRASLHVAIASVYAGLFGGFALARIVPQAAIRGGRWPVFIERESYRRFAASRKRLVPGVW